MRSVWAPACLCALSVILTGCVRGRADPVRTASTPADKPRPSKTTREVGKLKEENRALQSRAVILAARLDEQLDREKRLAREVNRLRFITAQQAEQIKALAGAPAARDAYRKKYEEMAIEVERLKKRIDQLQQIISVLRGRSSPLTTRPTAP